MARQQATLMADIVDLGLRTWPRGGTPLVDGAIEEGACIIRIDGAAAGVVGYFRSGEQFYCHGVCEPDGVTRKPLTATADVDSDQRGQLVVPIKEHLYAAGPAQNVNRLPVDNEMIGIQNLPVATLSQFELAQSVLIRCHQCWCLVRLYDVEHHDAWHRLLKEEVSCAGIGIGGRRL